MTQDGTSQSSRLLSLDALRGADMLCIMGFGLLVKQICIWAGWGADCALARQFDHVIWHGLRFEDLIFPIFLFIAGISFPYSAAKQKALGRSRTQILLRCTRRAAALVLLGMVHGGAIFRFDFAANLMGSVLARIGFAWLGAAVLYLYFSRRARIAIAAAILLGYWMLLLFVPAPDAAEIAKIVPERFAAYADGPFSPAANLSGYLDRLVMPGRFTIPGVMCNQGSLSTLPAIVTAMLGMFTGEFVRGRGAAMSGCARTLRMLAAGMGLVAAGCVVAFGFGRWSMPLNKILWSSSFVLVAGGISLTAFATFHYVIDVRGFVKWSFFFRVIGMNSITIYVAQRMIDFKRIGAFFLGGVAGLFPSQGADVVFTLGHIAACWLFLYFLYRKKTFLKV